LFTEARELTLAGFRLYAPPVPGTRPFKRAIPGPPAAN
jgi:hypothetical protein